VGYEHSVLRRFEHLDSVPNVLQQFRELFVGNTPDKLPRERLAVCINYFVTSILAPEEPMLDVVRYVVRDKHNRRVRIWVSSKEVSQLLKLSLNCILFDVRGCFLAKPIYHATNEGRMRFGYPVVVRHMDMDDAQLADMINGVLRCEAVVGPIYETIFRGCRAVFVQQRWQPGKLRECWPHNTLAEHDESYLSPREPYEGSAQAQLTQYADYVQQMWQANQKLITCRPGLVAMYPVRFEEPRTRPNKLAQ
jgi:hypothetical protein